MKKYKEMDEFPLLNEDEGIPLFYPHIPSKAIEGVGETLNTRWIGQGPKVDRFENEFKEKIGIQGYPVAVSSGTAALHMAYIMAGIGTGDEVICPIYTCTATNLPIIYLNAVPVFCDVKKGCMNINVDNIEKLITDKTKAISVVDYGGKPCDYEKLRYLCDKYNLKLIADCAHAIDGNINGKHVTAYADYTIYSFQAIKVMTTGDGGMVVLKNHEDIEYARRLRWFGIDRAQKQKGIWENDIKEIGYKYQMNDIAASIGLEALKEIDGIFRKRRDLADIYFKKLKEIGLKIFEDNNCENDFAKDFTPWLITIHTEGERVNLMKWLRERGIESAQVHYRNDRYSVFETAIKTETSNIDDVENDYLVLPLHTKMNEKDVITICEAIKGFYQK